MKRIFVYGTLKRGGANHGLLSGQRFLGTARTKPSYRMVNLGNYPGLVPSGTGAGVNGELWEVDEACLAALDALEGTGEGLYRREPARLEPPHGGSGAELYLYLRSVEGLPDAGADWPT